jgi:hypothetical protein
LFDLRNEIRNRAVLGDSLEVIETDVIAPAVVSDEDQRDSLWLYAWSVCSSGPYHAAPPEAREHTLAVV